MRGHAYWYRFIYRYGVPAFDFGHLRHDDGSAFGRTYEMYSRRMGKTGTEKVTRSDSQPGCEVLKTFSMAQGARRGKR